MSAAGDPRVHVVPLRGDAEPDATYPAGWPFLAGVAGTFCALRDGSARELLAWHDVGDAEEFLVRIGAAMTADGWHWHTLRPGVRTGTFGAYHRGETWRVLTLEARASGALDATLVEGRWEHFWPGAPPD